VEVRLDEPAGGLCVLGSRSSTRREIPQTGSHLTPAGIRLVDVLVFPPTVRPGGRGPRTLPPAMRGPLNRPSPVPPPPPEDRLSRLPAALPGPAAYRAGRAPMRRG
jgi:hypothetical protein